MAVARGARSARGTTIRTTSSRRPARTRSTSDCSTHCPPRLSALPFAPMRPAIAGTLFFFVSATLLAFGLTSRRQDLAKLPLFASAPFCMAAVLGQWAPLMTAAAVAPGLQFLFVCEAEPWPRLLDLSTDGSRSHCRRGRSRLATLLIIPTWPFDWRHALEAAPRYKGPLMRGISGLILLLRRDLRWRRREGRLFLAMSVVPQLSLFYDQLPLWLDPETRCGGRWRCRRSAGSPGRSWYPSRALTSSVAVAEPWVFWLVYVPALALLLLLPTAR